MIFLDTNILLRSKQADSEHHAFVTKKIIDLAAHDEMLVINPQVIYEFYFVASRPAEMNGLGLSSEIAMNEIDYLPENDQVFIHWKN